MPGLIQRVREGLQLAVVTDAGMPSVSDPGYLIVREAVRSGLKVEVIPGVSALTTALAGSGLPTDQFSFLGFAPSRSGERKRWLADRVGPATGTVVLFEAPGRLQGFTGRPGSHMWRRYVVVAHELTKVHESWHRGRLSELTRDGLSPALPERGEFVVLVSDQMGLGRRGLTPCVPDEAEVAAMFERVSQDRRSAGARS